MLRLFGILFVLGAIGSALGEFYELRLPTLSWGFELSRSAEFLRWGDVGEEGYVPWFGWLAVALALFLGMALLVRFWKPESLSPLTRRRIERFKRIRRGYYSFLILLGLAALASLDQILVGSEALVVKYRGSYHFPAFTQTIEKGEDFGVTGDLEKAPARYRELQQRFREEKGEDWVVMPLWPYAPTNDNIPALASLLREEGGLVYDHRGQPRSGLGTRVYDPRKPEVAHLQYRFREGRKDGPAFGWNKERDRVYRADYKDGTLVPRSEVYTGEGTLEDFFQASAGELYNVDRPPSAPVVRSASPHFLGTNSQGYDVISYLFGGLKVNIQAALIYIPLVYAIGVSIGLLMGYFGGGFDLVVQRIIEVLSNIPFLFLVIIVGASVPAQWKDRFGLYIILGILAIFGWMGMTYLMRTAALREKARDYIAATRVLGATTPRILFKHLLPNSIAIVVTLIPFSVSGMILSLTSLDYLGFGLPPKYATWGKLLRDGLNNLSSPWLATSAFVALVGLLVLVTFVGEAVREAFDPKKFTYYR